MAAAIAAAADAPARQPPPAALPRAPKRRSSLPFPPLDLLSADQIESIHETSLQVLREIGMEVMLPEARDRLRAAGAEVTGEPRHLSARACRKRPRVGTVELRVPCPQPRQRSDHRPLRDLLRDGGERRPTAPTWKAAAAPAPRPISATSSSWRSSSTASTSSRATRWSRSISTPRSAISMRCMPWR